MDLPSLPSLANLGAKTYTNPLYDKKTIPDPIPTAPDLSKIREGIAYNETRGVKGNPYAYFRNSGNTALGRALGRYQVTEGELKSYGKRYLGYIPTAQEYLSNPKLQDKYVESKAKYYTDQGYTPQQFADIHRSGFTKAGAPGSTIYQNSGYVTSFDSYYQNAIKSEAKKVPIRSAEMAAPVDAHNGIGTIIKDTITGIPKAFSETIGQPSLRAYAALGGAITGNTLTPEGSFQKDLYGTDKPITLRSVGSEFPFINKDSKIAPVVGLFAGAGDLIPGEKAIAKTTETAARVLETTKEVLFGLNKKFGPELTKLIASHSPELAHTALTQGSEHTIASALNLDPVKVTIAKLTMALKEAKPIRNEAEVMAAVERSRRAAVGSSVLAQGSGQKGFYKTLGTLKGELPKPKYSPVVTEEAAAPVNAAFESFQNAKLEYEFAKEALDMHAAKPLAKYANNRTGELPEVLGTGKSKFGRTGDSIVTEHGFSNSEEARSSYQDYLEQKKRVTELGQYIRQERPTAPKIEITPRLNQSEVDQLFDHVKTSNLDFYTKINAMSGLEKVLGKLGGQIPTNSELTLLRDIFGKEFTQAILSKRTIGQKIFQNITDALNIPRALMSSIDMSAPFRQGLVLSISHPNRTARAFSQMFKYFGQPKYFNAAMQIIKERPLYKLGKESGLYLGETAGEAFTLNAKEETFMSNLAEKIPGIGKLVSASERAYVGYLNKLRADVFDDLANTYIGSGISPKENPVLFEKLADFINTTTGRGSLGIFNKAAPLLNSVFFSPRLMASRIQMFNPVWYARMPASLRKEAAKTLVKFVGTGLSVLALAKLGGAEVETDPRSSDFGKIKIGNTRWDIWGGFQQWVRLTAQLKTGEMKSTTTGNITELGSKNAFGTTRLDRIINFGFGKFAPVPSLVTDLLRGQTIVGEKQTLSEETINRLIPLYFQDISDAVKQEGVAGGAAVAVPAFFGVGVQTYQPSPSKGLLPKISVPGGLPTLPKLPSL